MKCERGKENALDTITDLLILSKIVVILYQTILRREGGDPYPHGIATGIYSIIFRYESKVKYLLQFYLKVCAKNSHLFLITFRAFAFNERCDLPIPMLVCETELVASIKLGSTVFKRPAWL